MVKAEGKEPQPANHRSLAIKRMKEADCVGTSRKGQALPAGEKAGEKTEKKLRATSEARGPLAVRTQ